MERADMDNALSMQDQVFYSGERGKFRSSTSSNDLMTLLRKIENEKKSDLKISPLKSFPKQSIIVPPPGRKKTSHSC